MTTTKDPNAWLEYSIQPQQLRSLLHPAMCGNGQFELMAELDRSRVSAVVCFGFGAEGLSGGTQCFETPSGLADSLSSDLLLRRQNTLLEALSDSVLRSGSHTHRKYPSKPCSRSAFTFSLTCSRSWL